MPVLLAKWRAESESESKHNSQKISEESCRGDVFDGCPSGICVRVRASPPQCMGPETKLELLRRRMAGMSVSVVELRRKELEYMSLIRIQVPFLAPTQEAPLLSTVGCVLGMVISRCVTSGDDAWMQPLPLGARGWAYA